MYHHHHHHHPRISSRRKSWNKTSGPLRKHRDQILIGSLVNSKQVNGRALQKDTFTARLLLYVYVAYPLPPPPKNSPGLHQSQEWYLAKVRWTCPPQSTPWRRPWAGQIGFLSFSYPRPIPSVSFPDRVDRPYSTDSNRLSAVSKRQSPWLKLLFDLKLSFQDSKNFLL